MLVDVAMSMFSYGKLESYARSGKELPVDGGYNKEQEITKNAAEILETHQCIPIGYWKGSGLSLALDLIAATLAGGRTSRMVGELPVETDFPRYLWRSAWTAFADKEALMKHIDETLRDMKTSLPVSENHPVYYQEKI